MQHEHTYTHIWKSNKNCRSLIQKKLTVNEQNNLNLLWEKMPYMETRLFGVAQEQGSTSWITVLPIRRLGFSLSKAKFRDVVRLRYKLDWKDSLVIVDIPNHTPCNKQCHELRDNIAEILEGVTYDVTVEPTLQPLTVEELKGISEVP